MTLTTLQRLDPHQSYRLTIHGEKGNRVVDVFGIPLDGRPHGRPGHDYLGQIVKSPDPKAHHASVSGPKTHQAASRGAR